MNRSKQPFSDGHFHPLQKIKCRDCGYTTKWYDMIERRSKQTKLLEGTNVVVPTLQQTLFVAGGRESGVHEDYGGTITDTQANDPAGTHDGSDLTYDEGTWTDVGGGPNDAASGHLGIIYTMDVCTFAGTIDFIRWVLRSIRIDLEGTPDTSQITPASGNEFVILPARPIITAWQTLSFDIATDPLDSQPWTPARIAARKSGFQLDNVRLSGLGVNFENQTRCSEFYLEVWGHQ
jgi:hypothetical protein